MTTEELRLEIQVAAKAAIKDLAATSSEVKRLMQETQSATPKADALKAAMARLQTDLKSSARSAQLFGDELGGLKDQQSILKGTIVDLINQGISPETGQLQRLKGEYDAVTEKLGAFDEGTDSLSGKLQKLAEAGIALAAAKKISQFAGNAVNSFAEADAAAARLDVALELRGMRNSLPELDSLAQSLQQVAGYDADLVKQLEAELIAQGKTTTETKKTIEAAAGLSAVTGDDLSTSIQKLAMTYSGIEGRMGNLIPELKNLTEEQLKNGAAIDIIQKKYEGFIGKTGDTSISLVRAKENFGDIKEAIGEGLAPEVRMGADLLGGLAEAISKSSEGVKRFAGVITAVVIAALVGLAVRTALATAREWGLFSAKMAVNVATAVANPLIWAGVAAALAAVASIGLLIAANNKEAKAISDKNAQYDSTSSTLTAAQRAAELYKTTLDTMSESELRAAKAALLNQEAHTSSTQVIQAADAKIAEINAELLERGVDDAKKAADELEKRAVAWKSAWAETYGKAQADQSSNPYASIDFEEQQKLADAAANGIGAKNRKIIDEINAYYAVKRQALAESIAQEEAELAAKLSKTKVDDLELEKAAQLATIGSLEAKATYAAGLTQEQILAIQARYAALRAGVEAKYAQEISDIQKKEAAEAAAAAFDLAHKAAAAAAAASISKVDDLELEAERALTLFEGTEEAKKALAASYAKQIADAQIEEDKRVFAERLAAAKANKNYGTYAGLAAEEAAKDTQLGQLAGFGGSVAADPMAMLIDAAVEFAMSLDSVQGLLNGISTMLEGAGDIIDPLLSAGTGDLLDSIVEIGSLLAQTAAPGLNILVLALKIATGIINIFVLPTLKLVGAAFAWLNDYVIVPVGNAIIKVINAVITGLNKALGWLGVHIATIEYLQTTAQLAATQTEIAEKTSAVSDTMSQVQELFSQKKDELKDAYDKNVTALQNLLELGAISASDYQARISTVNRDYKAAVDTLESEEKAQLAKLQDILDALNAGNNISAAVLHAAGVAGYAVGAIEIPATQAAIVHKGETIIPASFAEGIRSGDLSLSKTSSAASGSLLYVTIHVAGSVTTENDLADKVATNVARRIKRKQLEIT